MFGLRNTLIRETIERLSDPEKWNGTGGYKQGKQCIVEACFSAAVDRSVNKDVNHVPALGVIRRIIENRFGISRGPTRRGGKDVPDIIKFNDHPLTTHDDVMWVLRQAEKSTKPFWRKALPEVLS